MAVRYQITLNSPMGLRTGLLTLHEAAGQIGGTLSLLGFDNPVEGLREGRQLRLRHPLRTLVSRLDCETVLHTEADALRGTVRVGPTCMDIQGAVLPDEIIERKKAHI